MSGAGPSSGGHDRDLDWVGVPEAGVEAAWCRWCAGGLLRQVAGPQVRLRLAGSDFDRLVAELAGAHPKPGAGIRYAILPSPGAVTLRCRETDGTEACITFTEEEWKALGRAAAAGALDGVCG